MSTPHNLDIHMYRFNEILELFNLSYDFGIEDLKRAKMILLKTHPDKSGLSSEYFLFYKKAFDIVVDYFKTTEKTSADVPQVNPIYNTSVESDNDKSIQKQISSTIKKMDKREFSQKFNQLFEKNMRKKDSGKNEWFSNETPEYDIQKPASSSGISSAIESLKKNSNAMSLYRGVEDMVMKSRGTSLYDEDEDENGNGYLSSDPFSKLKYDDLRKVHKDQTVFAVSESDYINCKKFNSHEELRQARGSQLLTPVVKEEAERILREREEAMRERMLAKQHSSKLQSMEYEQKNKSVLSSFLYLGN
jgi:hypothetical protein